MPGPFAHDVLFFDTTEELLTVTVPFLRQGLANGEAAVVVDAGRNGAPIAYALGDDPRIGHLTRDAHQRPARTLSMFQHTVEEALAAGARGVRLAGDVGLPVRPSQWGEWVRFEAAFNDVLAGYPVQAICPWNVRQFSDEALHTVRRTHPSVITARSRRRNPDYLEPRDYLRRFAAPAPDPLESTGPALTVDNVTDLEVLRRALEETLAGSPLPVEYAEDLAFAVNEVASNALQHGRPPVQVRLWCSRRKVLCTVRDHGRGFDDPLAGYHTEHHADPARHRLGLWLARRLCDRLDFFPHAEHFTVRLTTTP
ncbi:anti-sigma factor RsbA family regulatory protein [Actinoplanes sp. NPDC049681]|uniref:anti-sigma factor RsbA family regulatory protein n=1 Tax=Actinoplanes sp. NPDC049681 TaxID=3363905 RepID=UPI003790CF37